MNKKFPRSLHPKELRTTDADCNYKTHCRGVVREVIGYLELRAKDDVDRFVWFSIDHLIEKCHRYKGPKYGERAVKYALKFLRQNHIISKRLTRTRQGVAREGVIVAPHAALFAREGRMCSFVGRLKRGTTGTWQRDPETRSWFWVRQSLRERTR